METGEGQDIPSWYCDSDSDDSIVVTISQMQDEAAKLQSTAAEIREELTGLLATLDDIEHRSTTDKRKKTATKAKPESGDGIPEGSALPEPQRSAALKSVDGGKEPGDSDDRYRDVSTASAEPPRHGSRGDMSASSAATDDDSKPFDARELLESLLDAVMERQSGAGDSLGAHPQLTSASKDDTQSSLKSCPGAEGQRSFGGVDVPIHSSDSDDHDVVVGTGASASPWEAVERRRLRRPRKPGSEGSVSSEARSSSTADDAYLEDADAVAAELAAADLELVDGSQGSYFLLE